MTDTTSTGFRLPQATDLDEKLQLKARIPEPILKRLRFLSEWKEPEGFRQMPNKDRLHMRSQVNHRHVMDEPTMSNKWVWFGSYHSDTGIAWLNNKYIQRQLHEIFVGKLHGQRLTNHLTDNYSDVNPFFAHPGMPGYLNHVNLRQGDNYFQDLAAHARRGLKVDEAKVTACIASIVDDGFVGGPMAFTQMEIRTYVSQEYDPPVIEEALKQLLGDKYEACN